MKNIITTTMALLALTVAANATDLPSKTKAPAAPAPVAAPAPAAPTDAITIGIQYDSDPVTNSNAKQQDTQASINWVHQLGGGLAVGAKAAMADTANGGNVFKGNAEADAYYTMPVFAGLNLKAAVGIGAKQNSGSAAFDYYALYTGADYKLNDSITLNAINYRYRNAFDTINNFESHQLATGVTYNLDTYNAVQGQFSRTFDTSWNATQDSFTLNYIRKF